MTPWDSDLQLHMSYEEFAATQSLTTVREVSDQQGFFDVLYYTWGGSSGGEMFITVVVDGVDLLDDVAMARYVGDATGGTGTLTNVRYKTSFRVSARTTGRAGQVSVLDRHYT